MLICMRETRAGRRELFRSHLLAGTQARGMLGNVDHWWDQRKEKDYQVSAIYKCYLPGVQAILSYHSTGDGV
jgi:hypothetical protein